MSLKIIPAGAVAAWLLAGPALAQTGPSGDPAAVEGGRYVVEPVHTVVLFDIDHLGFTKYYGRFTGLSGALTLDPGNPSASRVSVSIPVASVNTPSDKLSSELAGPTFLDAGAYPTITFVSRSVNPTGPTTAQITGDLTMHGVTRPVTLAATFHGGGVNVMTRSYMVGFDAVTRLKRSDFGVKTYLPMLGDDVEVTISAAFEKAK